MAQASGCTNYTGQQQPAGEYFTEQKLSYLEALFNTGVHYPDIPRLSMNVRIPERILGLWFEKRREVCKQATMAFYSRVALMQQHQLQQRMMVLQTMQQPQLQYRRMALQQPMEQQQQQQQKEEEEEQLQVNTGISQVCKSSVTD